VVDVEYALDRLHLLLPRLLALLVVRMPRLVVVAAVLALPAGVLGDGAAGISRRGGIGRRP
jgi:hypothetical protein